MVQHVTSPKRKPIPNDGSIVQQPSRPVSKWDVGDIEKILDDSDSGSFSLLGDFCESLWTDYQIRSAGEQRILGLQGLPLTFYGDADESTLRQEFWRLFPAPELAKAHRYALMAGVAILYMRPNDRRNPEDAWMPRAEAWHPRFYHYDQYYGMYRVATWGGPGYTYVRPDDPNWLIISPYGCSRPWAEGLWRSLGFAWILKRFALFDRARHSEVAGSPIRVGIAPQGSTQRQRENWQSLLERLGRDAAFVLPPGYDLKLVEATGKGEMYEAQIDWADQAFAKLWTGQPITTQGSNMGFGEGTVFADIKLDLIRFDAKFLSEEINPWLDNWSKANTGNSAGFQFLTDPPKTLEERASGIGALGEAVANADAALGRDGLRVDVAKLYRDAGVPLLSHEADQASTKQVDRYHLEYGILTINEVREGLGLDPLPDGDRVPVPFVPTDPGRAGESTGFEPEETEQSDSP